MENAIIAGGFLRDHILGGDFKDIDIFIPAIDIKDFIIKIAPLRDHKDFDISDAKKFKYKYGCLNAALETKVDCKYLNKFSVDLVAMKFPDDENFGNSVIDTFNYWIDRVYHNGKTLVESAKFTMDKDYRTATLCKLHEPTNLIGAMRKYERLLLKYPDFKFNTTLRIEEDKDQDDRDTDTRRTTTTDLRRNLEDQFRRNIQGLNIRDRFPLDDNF